MALRQNKEKSRARKRMQGLRELHAALHAADAPQGPFKALLDADGDPQYYRALEAPSLRCTH